MKQIRMGLPRRLSAGRMSAIASCLLLMTVSVTGWGQSMVRQYPLLQGDNMLVRTDNATFVTCCNTTDKRSCFVVDDGTTARQFFTTEAPAGIHVTDSGYVVNDMQLVDGFCWFAGYKWVNTGMPVYTLDGQMYILITHEAFVGKFKTSQVLSGNGNYRIALIPQVHHIERLAVMGDDVTAIGVAETGERYLVEMLYGGDSNLLRIETSSSSEEEFMDVVAAGNKVVVLSRFNNAAHFMWYKYYFGLRYGSAGNMFNTGIDMQIYDVYEAYGWYTAFPSVHPVRLAATNNANGVVVAYIEQDSQSVNPLLGKFVLFHIPGKGTLSTDVVFNLHDEFQYTALDDIRFNKSLSGNSYMALLLRGSMANSILRFPYLNFPQSLSEDVYHMNDPYIESVAPFQYGGVGLELSAVGHYMGNSQSLAGITEHGVHHYTANTCFSIESGHLNSMVADSWIMELPQSLKDVIPPCKNVYKRYAYRSIPVLRMTTCQNGNQ